MKKKPIPGSVITDSAQNNIGQTDCKRTDEPMAVSVSQAASMAGISRAMLYTEMKAGRLGWAKIGKRRVIPAAQLRAWLDAATTKH